MVGRPGLGLRGLGLSNLEGFATPPQVNLHANGGPVLTLASTGLVLSPLGNGTAQTKLWEGELQELQVKIEMFRNQLRDALARRAEIQSSLARERSVLISRNTSMEREQDKQRIQTINKDTSSSTQSKLPERDGTNKMKILNNLQTVVPNPSRSPGTVGQGRSSQLNTVNSLDRGRVSQSQPVTLTRERIVQSCTSARLEQSARNIMVQTRNTSSLDRQKPSPSHTLNTLDRTKANQSVVNSRT